MTVTGSSRGAATTAATDLKAKHRAMWASGDYAGVAEQVIPTMGQALVEACRVQPGQRVLDVAAGSGNAAIPAARLGADVVAADLTPELLERGKAAAEGEGLKLEWREADAEAMPFDDDTFDVTLSCVGVMFAPHHQASADELVRVTRPGGTIGLANWTPEGVIGRMFATMKPYVAPPPPGASPPPLWGKEEHVRELFGDRVERVVAERRMQRIDRFGSPEEFRDFFKANYGPTIAAYKQIADQPDKVASLDAELAELSREAFAATEGTPDAGTMLWEYLLLTGRVR
nr:class I SAM-dependent methyltransferase [uncultured Nocardioides sp.]